MKVNNIYILSITIIIMLIVSILGNGFGSGEVIEDIKSKTKAKQTIAHTLRCSDVKEIKVGCLSCNKLFKYNNDIYGKIHIENGRPKLVEKRFLCEDCRGVVNEM